MPDWLANVLVALGSAGLMLIGALRRGAKREAEMEGRIDAADAKATEAKTAAFSLAQEVRAISDRTSRNETSIAVHAEGIARIRDDVTWIRQGVAELLSERRGQ